MSDGLGVDVSTALRLGVRGLGCLGCLGEVSSSSPVMLDDCFTAALSCRNGVFDGLGVDVSTAHRLGVRGLG